MRKLPALLVALCLTGAVAGCSGSSEGGSPGTTDGSKATTTTAKDGGKEPVVPVTTTTTSIPKDLNLTEGLVFGLAGAADDDLQLTQDEADCVGPKWIAVVGEDALRSARVTPESLAHSDIDFSSLSLTPQQGDALVAALGACDVDARQLMLRVLGAGQEERQQDCLEEEIDEALAERLLVAGLTGGRLPDALQAQLAAIDDGCGVR
jgi:hypothetical protein